MKFRKLLFLSMVFSPLVLADLEFFEADQGCCEDQTEISYEGHRTLADFTDKYVSDWNNPREEDFWGTHLTDYEADVQFDTNFFY